MSLSGYQTIQELLGGHLTWYGGKKSQQQQGAEMGACSGGRIDVGRAHAAHTPRLSNDHGSLGARSGSFEDEELTLQSECGGEGARQCVKLHPPSM